MTAGTIDLITSKQQKIALRGIRVQSRLTAMGQRTTVEQTFLNLEDEAVEVTYTFPLPERAAVCGFEVITGERILTGVVEEVQKASEMYESAIGRGDAAYHFRQHRPDVFSIEVGNIKPQQMALVRITYISELEVTDSRIRLAYPTVVAPRYATATATDPLEALHDAHVLNPPHVLEVPYGLSLDVEVALGRPIRSIQSPSHAIHVQPSNKEEYHLTLAAGLTETNREIVLDIDLGQEQQPHAESAAGPDGDAYVAVTFVPELEEPDTPEPSSVVFVLDCSGSMQGESIDQAKLALDLCLRHLSLGDVFNICRFGSEFEWMSPEPLAYSQHTMEKAIAYVRGIRADLGGTELYGPLESFLKQKPPVGASRQVVLLTDGQISNEAAVIDLARKHRACNRFFTFGIGPASSRHLVRGLAEATRGAAEFITEGERIEDKVLRTFSRLATPALTDLAIRWVGVNGLEQAPAEIPPVFDGDAMVVYARCAGKNIPSRVTLKCGTPTGTRAWTLDVPPAVRSGETLPLLWARRMIQSLGEADSNSPAGRERLVALSKQFGLLCRHTSFIAIEHRSPEERNNGRPATRRIPVQIPSGWHGIEDPGLDDVLYCCLDDTDLMSEPPRPAVSGVAHGFLGRIARLMAPRKEAESIDLFEEVSGPPLDSDEHDKEYFGGRRAEPPPEYTAFVGLLTAQQADGSFNGMTDSVVPGWTAAKHEAEAWLAGRGARPGSEPADRIVSTLAALIILQRDMPDLYWRWRRAVAKGEQYLAKELGWKVKAVQKAVDKLCRAK